MFSSRIEQNRTTLGLSKCYTVLSALSYFCGQPKLTLEALPTLQFRFRLPTADLNSVCWTDFPQFHLGNSQLHLVELKLAHLVLVWPICPILARAQDKPMLHRSSTCFLVDPTSGDAPQVEPKREFNWLSNNTFIGRVFDVSSFHLLPQNHLQSCSFFLFLFLLLIVATRWFGAERREEEEMTMLNFDFQLKLYFGSPSDSLAADATFDWPRSIAECDSYFESRERHSFIASNCSWRRSSRIPPELEFLANTAHAFSSSAAIANPVLFTVCHLRISSTVIAQPQPQPLI